MSTASWEPELGTVVPGNRVVDAGAQSGCQGFGTMPGVRVGLLSPKDNGTNWTLGFGAHLLGFDERKPP